MKLTTEVTIPQFPFKISYQDKLLSIGSCFAENIGSMIQSEGFDVELNPFGILFDPSSIRNTLNQNFQFSEEHLVLRGGSYCHLNAHSKHTKEDAQELLDELNQSHQNIQKRIKDTDVVMLTFGTAWVYKYLQTNSTIANCHKVKASEFQKELLDVKSELGHWKELIQRLVDLNPTLQIIFTVSPVRHVKNGLWENNVSKGVLHQIIHELCVHFKQCHYFPSYEILMDELRDYRFYKDDLLHPTNLSIEYIYERFSASVFSNHTNQLRSLQQKINVAKAHRFMQPTTEVIAEHEAYIQDLEKEFERKLKA